MNSLQRAQSGLFESQGQSNMIQNTVEPIVLEKGQGLGTPLPSVGKVKTKTAPKGPSTRAGTEESGYEDWEAGRTRPRAGACDVRSLAGQSCVH